MNNILRKTVLYHEEKRIDLIRITNASGAYVEVLNYGACLVSVAVPDRRGRLDNVVLAYNGYGEYMQNPFLLGATVGRVANRISNAAFTLDGVTYRLDRNDGRNSIHGGVNGFHRKMFDYETEDGTVLLQTISRDGEGGFPGNLTFSVRYSFSDENRLSIEYEASSDRATPVNFTNHAYFNLSGEKSGRLGDELLVDADAYVESDDEFLPTGKILPVAGTAFDFRAYARIADRLKLKNDRLEGYNAYFVKRADHADSLPLASWRNLSSGRAMDVYTSMPGVLVYTGDYLSKPFVPFEGICFEAQYHPDGLNHPTFHPPILYPGEVKTDRVEYHFHLV
jgi:aldose 1-epimerase